jgi:ATP-dependent DNA ligase
VLTPPITPMLARASDTLPPVGRVRDALYQPKVDGYRVLLFVRQQKVFLQSREGKDLTGAFPEVAEAGGILGEDAVLDGELVTHRTEKRGEEEIVLLDFAALQSRARRRGDSARNAARKQPAHVVLFDVLEAAGEVLMNRPYRERLAILEDLFAHRIGPPWTLVTSTSDRAAAARWLNPEWGPAGIEGVVVKSADGTYRPGERGWTKVRAFETAEGVVAGVTGPPRAPGTLLLGRYDVDGDLRLIARTTPIPPAGRRELGAVLAPVLPGHPWQGVRFSAGWRTRDALVWTPVAPEVVAEFRGDTAVDRGRYRHPVRYLRMRADLAPGDLPLLGSSG